ncbi:MAG: cyclodeaminase/cyclohydrolase family protein [Firmicutes bacterium]|nr:cyclodeaminase/cyclohydrolase family protein [Bacillota bacterium]
MEEKSIKKFLHSLASKEPIPGGGAAAALMGAVGAALLSMVANLTAGREKYKASEALMEDILKEAPRLLADLTNLMARDAAAFAKVAEVFKMPRDTQEEKLARRERMQESLRLATEVPLTIMEKAVEVLRLHERSLGKSNPSAISDTGVGALCLKAALQGAWLNVEINLKGISDDEFVQVQREMGQKLLTEGVSIADRVYETVLREMD